MAITSIVDFLKGIGKDSSYNARKAQAGQYGINNYTGTADQNTQMLTAMQKPPAVATAQVPKVVPKIVAQVPSVVPKIVDLNTKPAVAPQMDYSKNISGMIKGGSYDPYAVIAEGNKRDNKITGGNMTGVESTSDLYKKLGFDPSKYMPGANVVTLTDTTAKTPDKVDSIFSPYTEDPKLAEMRKTFSGMANPYAAGFNVENDPGFKQFKDTNVKLGNDTYNSEVAGMSVPGLADSSIGRQVAEAGRSGYMNRIQDAIPQFYDKAKSDYQNAYNVLDNASKDDYTMYKDNQVLADKQLQKQVDTIGQYSDNYQAEINKRTAINPNDPLIPYISAARQGKFDTIKANGIVLNTQAKKDTMDIWEKTGIANATTVKMFPGVKLGQFTESYQKHLDDVAATAATLKNTEEFRKAQLAISRGNLGVSQKNAEQSALEFGWKKNNVAKGLNADGTPNKTGAMTASDYSEYIDDKFYVNETRDEMGQIPDANGKIIIAPTGNKISTGRKTITVQAKKDLYSYISGLKTNGVDESILKSLLTKYDIVP